MLRPAFLLVCAFALHCSASAENRLAGSQSPYLLQHADNPVDWYPWGEEAFAKAQAEDKLVLVSIGYSTCHWCHVMNRESFSDPQIAAYLKERYVCIKVDREERPDIDSVYMSFVQNLRGMAGWPLNVWLTPEKKPFYGGTYFPPRSDPERGPGFLETITEIQGFWEKDAQAVRERSQQFVAALNARDTASGGASEQPSMDSLADAIAALFFQFDETNGGFGQGEKFPSPGSLSMLLRAAALPELHPEDRDLSKRMALQTLDAIASGGIRDHIGGGFHRYTVDAGWQLPHFEKMLYDQALLARAFTDAWQLTGNPRYQTAATEALDYLLRDLRDPGGAFYSAEDAESADPENPNTKREGAFYLWTVADFKRLIPDDEKRRLALAYFSVQEDGNAPAGNFPTEPFAGYNTLRIETELADVAKRLGIPLSKAESWIAEVKQTLLDARARRPKPHLDDKIITSWNGLAVSALARAAQAFERPDYAAAAREATEFLFAKLYDERSGRLARLYRRDASPVDGFAEDYAFLVEGLLDLYEATADHRWIERAENLQTIQDELFLDRESGGYFLFRKSEDIVFNRSKERTDAALPSPSSISAKNLVRLAQLSDNASHQQQAKNTLAAFAPRLESAPTSMPGLLEAMAYVSKKPLQIVIAGDPASDSVKQLLRIVNQRLIPNRSLVYADQGAGQAFLGQRLEFIKTANAFDGKATAYVCENYVCQMPTQDPEKLAAQLDDRLAPKP